MNRWCVTRIALVGAVVAAASGCAPAPVGDGVAPAVSAEGASTTLLVRGASVVRRNGAEERLDLLLRNREGWFLLVATSVDGVLSAPDTMDVSGMFIHSTHAFLPEVETVPSNRNFAMYVVRTGDSPASPAVWRIDRDMRRVEPDENHPPGPADPAVGCYGLERGEWSDERFEWDPRSQNVWFPDRLRLHWQYQWLMGAARFLVATNGEGRVGTGVVYHGWQTSPPDSLDVTFTSSYDRTTFRGAEEEGGYAGELEVASDGGYRVSAPATLTRRNCADGG